MPQQPATPSNSSFDDDLAAARSDFDADLKAAQDAISQQQAVPHPIAKRLLEWLPSVGGALGGVAGAVLGTPEGGVGAIPLGVAGAMAGGAAGRSLENTINAAIGNPAPKTAAESLGSAGRAGLTQGALEGAGAVVAPIATRAAGAIMQSAVKPSTKETFRAIVRGVQREDLPVVKTLLNEGINVTPGGIAKLDKIINSTNAQIREAVDGLPATIDPARVAQRVDNVEARVAQQVNPASDVAAVRSSRDEFLANPKVTEATAEGAVPRKITPAEAQDLKIGTHRSLKSKAYGELKSPQIEAQKALTRGLKEEIETAASDAGRANVGALNAREGGALVAREAIAKRLAAAGNRDPVSLAWLAHNPTAGLLFIAERSPGVKSMLARGLYQSASRASGVPQNVLRLLVQSVASASEEPQ